MNDEEALLRAVCANPDDDTPRLVYADYLEERDDREKHDAEQAEFIRLWVRAWRLERDFISMPEIGKINSAEFMEYNKAKFRADDLIRNYHGQWLRPPPGFRGVKSYYGGEKLPRLVWFSQTELTSVYLRFQRGMIHSLTMHMPAFPLVYPVLDNEFPEALHPIQHVSFFSLLPELSCLFSIDAAGRTLCCGKPIVSGLRGILLQLATRFPGVTFKYGNEYAEAPAGHPELAATGRVY